MLREKKKRLAFVMAACHRVLNPYRMDRYSSTKVGTRYDQKKLCGRIPSPSPYKKDGIATGDRMGSMGGWSFFAVAVYSE